VGRGVSDGALVADGGTGVSVDEGIASGVGEEQEIKRKKKEERSASVAIVLCMGGF
jgi:hypothetical protein